MKIKIESDVLDIIKRIKEIDDGYYIMYNQNNKKFEVHNSHQKRSYCLTIPYSQLDERTIKMIYETSIKNYDKITRELEEGNKKYQEKEIDKVKEINDYKIREILRYSGAGVRDIGSAFKSTWL